MVIVNFYNEVTDRNVCDIECHKWKHENIVNAILCFIFIHIFSKPVFGVGIAGCRQAPTCVMLHSSHVGWVTGKPPVIDTNRLNRSQMVSHISFVVTPGKWKVRLNYPFFFLIMLHIWTCLFTNETRYKQWIAPFNGFYKCLRWWLCSCFVIGSVMSCGRYRHTTILELLCVIGHERSIIQPTILASWPLTI